MYLFGSPPRPRGGHVKVPWAGAQTYTTAAARATAMTMPILELLGPQGTPCLSYI